MKLSISQAQDLLDGLGYKPGPSCGSLNDPTRKALSRFQLDEHILTTGVLDTLTEEKLIARAEAEGVGEKFPWWVWAGIVVGSGFIVWGIWTWVDGTKKLKDARARERMVALVNEYDQGPVAVRALNAPRASTEDFRAYGPDLTPSQDAEVAAAVGRLMRVQPPVPFLPATPDPGPEWREFVAATEIDKAAPSTIAEPPVPATERQAALSGFGPKRASVAEMVKLDAEAQAKAYARWASAMKGIGNKLELEDDFERNLQPMRARAEMDDPDHRTAFDASMAEFIRTDVQKADPKAQARFRKYVDIYRKQLMRKKFGE